jgi:hypothetical protein
MQGHKNVRTFEYFVYSRELSVWVLIVHYIGACKLTELSAILKHKKGAQTPLKYFN